MNLPANAKVVDLAENLFSQDISAATCISFSSDQEVVGFQINGSTDGMMLDGLPALTAAGPPVCDPEFTAYGPQDIGNPLALIYATITSACGVDIDQSSFYMTLDGTPISPLTLSGSGSQVTASYQVTFPLETYVDHCVYVYAKDVNGASDSVTFCFEASYQ